MRDLHYMDNVKLENLKVDLFPKIIVVNHL